MIIKITLATTKKKIKIIWSKILNIQAIKSKTTKEVSQSGATFLFVIFIDTFNGNFLSEKIIVVVSAGTGGPDETLR